MTFEQCPSCGQHDDATSRLHETRRRLAAETARADDLERGIKEIVYNLTQRQPMPRNASVTYVAGYARAMDDMRQTIADTARRHRSDTASIEPSTTPTLEGDRS